MSKITVRIPTEQYAYIEVEFSSVEEYEKDYPKVAAAIVKTRQAAKEAVKLIEQPF